MSETGLAEGATAELGVDSQGWSNGTRGHVTLSRSTSVFVGPETVPTPSDLVSLGVDVLDVGWSLPRLKAVGGWIGEQVRAAPVVVIAATASVPSLRRLEITLTSLPSATTTIVGVRSLGARRLPGHIRAAIGPRTQRRMTDGAWIDIRYERDLSERGLTGAPLPRPLLNAAHQIVRLAGVGETTPKGNLT